MLSKIFFQYSFISLKKKLNAEMLLFGARNISYRLVETKSISSTNLLIVSSYFMKFEMESKSRR